MKIIRRIFRVIENETIIGAAVCLITAILLICACVVTACFMIFEDTYYLIISIVLAIIIIVCFCNSIDEMRQSIRGFRCVRRGKKYDGKIIGRTSFVKLSKNHNFEYAAKLIIEYADGRIHRTKYFWKPQIDRLISTDCCIYIYKGVICVDDFRAKLFKPKQRMNLSVLE